MDPGSSGGYCGWSGTRTVVSSERGQFLLDYIDLLLNERADEDEGFRHVAQDSTVGVRQSISFTPAPSSLPSCRRNRWVINKTRALMSWYSKGLEGGSSLRLAVNAAQSVKELRMIIGDFFEAEAPLPAHQGFIP